MSENIGPTKLGSCCNCGREDETVRHIITLELKSPEPGQGCWGCLVCGLPQAGAVAVLCDECVRGGDIPMPKAICLGFPGKNRRAPISSVTGVFEHDEAKHAEDSQLPPDKEVMNFAGQLADAIIDQLTHHFRREFELLAKIERHQRN